MSANIALYNPKSPSNVGSVLRAVGCFSATSVSYSGERYKRAAQYNTDTKNIQSTLPIKHCEDLLLELPKDHEIVCVELVEGAISLPEFVHPPKANYIFGPEDGSLPQQIVNKADHVIYIPTRGCLNLAATVNILLYDRLSKTQNQFDPEQIKTSRDVNNRLKVNDSNS